MATGIEINDASGKLQFNGEMLTYSLRLSGTTYVENRKLGNTCQTSFLVPSTNTYTQALVAIGGGNGYAAARYNNYSNAQQWYGTNGAPVGTPFTYYIFERSSTIPASGFGLEVRNSANQITFSSNQRVMNVVNMIGGIVNNGEQSVTYGGRTLAYCQGSFAAHRIGEQVQTYYNNGGGGGGVGGPITGDEPDPGGGGGGYTEYSWRNNGKLYGGVVLNNGQTVNTRMVGYDDVQIGRTVQSPPEDWYQPLVLFVVDVTGFPVGAQFF